MSVFDELEKQKCNLQMLSEDLKNVIARLGSINGEANSEDIDMVLKYAIKELGNIDDLMHGN